MTKVSETVVLPFSADRLWKIISRFGKIDTYLPAIKSCVATGNDIGDSRGLTLANNEVIIEKLMSLEIENRTLSYSIQSSPFPIDSHLAVMRVVPIDTDSCEFTWSSTFHALKDDEAAMIKLFKDIYLQGIKGMEALAKELA